MEDPPVTLISVRPRDGAPVILQPYASPVWGTTKRLRQCDLWALPEWPRDISGAAEMAGMFTTGLWPAIFKRDVTLWPVDEWSSAVFTMIAEWHARTETRKRTFTALRWAWGSPFSEELGEPPAKIETLWKRPRGSEQKAA